MGVDLNHSSVFLRVLADPTRVRLLALLEREELTVAELAQITHLAQPRVSTHLGKLREIRLVTDRRAGVSSYYRFNPQIDQACLQIWHTLRDGADDPILRDDEKRLNLVLDERAGVQKWADSVAGDMERHYSPGRTWEATARAAVRLLELGDVIDIASGDGVMAELLAAQAKSITCVDASEAVVQAGIERTSNYPNASFKVADMHHLPFSNASFDTALLMHALTYSTSPQQALAEASRVLRPGGRLVAITLNAHDHEAAVAPFNHQNLGFAPEQLCELARAAGLAVDSCQVTSREQRAPHFEVVTLTAHKK